MRNVFKSSGMRRRNIFKWEMKTNWNVIRSDSKIWRLFALARFVARLLFGSFFYYSIFCVFIIYVPLRNSRLKVKFVFWSLTISFCCFCLRKTILKRRISERRNEVVKHDDFGWQTWDLSCWVTRKANKGLQRKFTKGVQCLSLESPWHV